MFLAQAAYSVSDQNITGMMKGLRAAMILYEQHPSQATSHLSHLCEMMLLIRVGRSLCAALGRPDIDFAALEHRAEALRRPLH